MRGVEVAAVATLTLALAALSPACGSGDQSSGNDDEEDTEIVQVGVYPAQFECQSLAPMGDLKAILGDDVEQADPPETNPPRGVASPCNFVTTIPATEVDPDAGPEETRPVSWSFDLDCREGAVADAEELREEYAAMEGDPDAGVPTVVEVDVGAWGTDHLDSQLLFVDDDVDCHVRVRGPTARGRLELARLVERHLTEMTAVRNPPEMRRKRRE